MDIRVPASREGWTCGPLLRSGQGWHISARVVDATPGIDFGRSEFRTLAARGADQDSTGQPPFAVGPTWRPIGFSWSITVSTYPSDIELGPQELVWTQTLRGQGYGISAQLSWTVEGGATTSPLSLSVPTSAPTEMRVNLGSDSLSGKTIDFAFQGADYGTCDYQFHNVRIETQYRKVLRAYPEGFYGPDAPAINASNFDPRATERFGSGLRASGFVANGGAPWGLVVAGIPDELGPPPAGWAFATDVPRELEFGRGQVRGWDTAFTPLRLWFAFNDRIGQFGDNVGAFAVGFQEIDYGEEAFMDRYSISQAVQIGKENTGGTPVPATVRLRSTTLQARPMGSFKSFKAEGLKRKSLLALTKEWSEATLSGLASYGELGFWLSSLVGNRTSIDQGGGVFLHTWVPNRNAPDAMATYTCEYGSNEGCERFSYGFVSALGFKMNRDDIELNGHLFGGKLLSSSLDGIGLTQGPNEVQHIGINGGPTGGTYTLGFGGVSTSALSFDSDAAHVQAALQGLATIGSGNVTVATSAGGFDCTFSGVFAHRNVASLSADGGGLTGGTSPSVSVSEGTRGGLTELTDTAVLPGDISVWMATNPALLGTDSTRLKRSFDSSWSFGERTKPFWTQTGGASYSGVSEVQGKEMLDLLVGADDQGMALLGAARGSQNIYVRIEGVSQGRTIGSSGTPYLFRLDASTRVAAFREFKDEQGIYSIGFELEVMDDPNWGQSYQFSLRNGISGY